MCRGTRSPAGSSGLGVTAVPRRSSDASRYLRRGTAEYQDVDGCTEVSGPARGRGRTERTAGNESEGGEKKKNLREDLRRTEPFCFPARGSLRPRLAQAHRSLRPHASTHGSGRGSPEYAPTVRGFPAAEHRPQRAHRLGGHRRCLTACLGSSITPCAARPPRSRGRISFPPPLAPASSSHTHTGHIPGLGHGSAPVPAARTRRSAARQTDG